MIKIFCLIVILAVAVAQPMEANKNTKRAINGARLGDAMDDLEKAETFGYGYNHNYYVVPRSSYGNYYGGYYPYHGYDYGYPSYGYNLGHNFGHNYGYY
ncbi:prisilkin-39-like [Armigeres subalbatus]|uniref:prisilkin-39-like n=1 Tax=Armigeres subalbatus TaxID=124917 RepID=UPI002ED555B6